MLPRNFPQLYTALDSAWLQHQKLKETSVLKHDVWRTHQNRYEFEILREQQGFYGIPRNINSLYSNTRRDRTPTRSFSRRKRKYFK